jgi:uncharacterized iron-regulated protein
MTQNTATLAGAAAAALVIGISLVSCAGGPDQRAGSALSNKTPTVAMIDPDDPAAVASLLDQLQDRQVVMVGEVHDRYDHHLNQLAVIRGLHERGVDVAVGMEYFQRPFQQHLDDFVAGRIDEAELLERTEWADRWRFDPDLYREILSYARENAIPLVALNASSETVRAVSQHGIAQLADDQRALFPRKIELAEGPYRRQLESVFAMHGNLPPERLQRFLEVQYVWDQTMARSAADHLGEHPDRTLVILAGSGHLLQNHAMPQRLHRLYPAKQAVLVTDTGALPPGATPDFVFAARDLPSASAVRIAGARGG